LDPSDFDNNAIIFISVTDTDGYRRGTDETTLTSDVNDVGLGYTGTIYVDSTSDFSDSSGILVVHDADTAIYGKFKYTSKTSNSFTGQFVFLNIGGTANFSAGDVVTNKFNPYEVDDCGIYMQVSMKSLVHGELRVGVKEISTQSDVSRWVAGLSGGGQIEDGMPKPIKVASSETLTFIWGGIDQTGITHPEKINNENNALFNQPDFFANDGEYYIQIEVTDLKTGQKYTYVTRNLPSTYNSPSEQIIGIKKSGVDNITIDLSYADPTRQDAPYMPVDGTYYFINLGNVQCYSNGTYNRLQAYDNGQSVHSKNYLLFEQEGGVRLNVRNKKLASRCYKVKAVVEYYTMELSAYARYTLPDPDMWGWAEGSVPWPSVRIYPNDGSEIDVFGGFVSFDENGKTINFDPETNEWGGDNYFNFIRYNDADDISGFYYHVVRLIMTIYDKSGRTVSVVDSNGNLINNDFEHPIYNENNYIVCELHVFPKSTDLNVIPDVSAGSLPV